jgi:hypothetical protein
VELRFLGSLNRAAREADENGEQELADYESLLRAGYVPATPYFDGWRSCPSRSTAATEAAIPASTVAANAGPRYSRAS